MTDCKTTEDASRYVFIGLGGIGGLLVRLMVPFLYSVQTPSTVLLVDGDDYEESNRARMLFREPGPKVLALAEELADIYWGRVTIVPTPHYVTADNVSSVVRNGDVVFCQPDNHATRRVVERRCLRLRDVALFSGGNDGVEDGKTGTYGNVQVYLRAGGQELTNRLTRFHPEIARPKDRLPTEQGCAAAAAQAPQLIFTNAAVASAMAGAFYAWRCGELKYEEAYFDILAGRMVPVERTVQRGPARVSTIG